MSAIWASVTASLPSIGLFMPALALPMLTITPALAPASAGPWMWAATASPDRPSKVTFQLIILVAVSMVNSAVPLPLLSLAGTSWAEVRLALNLTISAWAAVNERPAAIIPPAAMWSSFM